MTDCFILDSHGDINKNRYKDWASTGMSLLNLFGFLRSNRLLRITKAIFNFEERHDTGLRDIEVRTLEGEIVSVVF